MSGGGGVPGGSDGPYYRRDRVDIDVNVNVKKNERPLCWHENHVGECLICERENDATSKKD